MKIQKHTVQKVRSLNDLKEHGQFLGQFLTGIVDVVEGVSLYSMNLERLPVQFGTVGGDFYCFNNRLTTLEGVPSAVGGDFWCYMNRLTSLEGAPGSVGRDFYCNNNRLTSLEGVHRILRRIGRSLIISGNPIESGGIGLILVEGLTRIGTEQPLVGIVEHPAFRIINRHLGQGMRGLLRCQEALHDAGLEEYAQL